MTTEGPEEDRIERRENAVSSFVRRRPFRVILASFAAGLTIMFVFAWSMIDDFARLLGELPTALMKAAVAELGTERSTARFAGWLADVMEHGAPEVGFDAAELAHVAKELQSHCDANPPSPSAPDALLTRASLYCAVGRMTLAIGDVESARVLLSRAGATLLAARAAGATGVDFERSAVEIARASAACAVARGAVDEAILFSRNAVEGAVLLASRGESDDDKVAHAEASATEARALELAGRFEEAKGRLRSVEDLRRDLFIKEATPRSRFALARAMRDRGAFLARREESVAAATELDAIAARLDELSADDPVATGVVDALADVRSERARLLSRIGRVEEAVRASSAAVAARRAVSSRDPQGLWSRRRLAAELRSHSEKARSAGDRRSALAALGEAAEIWRGLAAAVAEARFAEEADSVLGAAAEAHAGAGRLAEARRFAESACDAARRALGEVDDVEARVRFRRVALAASALAREDGSLEVAFERAREAADASADARFGAEASMRAGESAREIGRIDLSATLFEQAADRAAAIAATHGIDDDARSRAKLVEATARIALGAARGTLGDEAAAKAQFGDAEALVSEAIKRGGSTPDAKDALANLRAAELTLARTAGRYAEAANAAVALVAALRREIGSGAGPSPMDERFRAASAARRLRDLAEGATASGPSDLKLAGEWLERQGRRAEAREAYERALSEIGEHAVSDVAAKTSAEEIDLRLSAARVALSTLGERAAIERLVPAVRALRSELAAAELRVFEEASIGGVASDAARAEAASLRRKIATLRDFDPAFTSLRPQDRFRALFGE